MHDPTENARKIHILLINSGYSENEIERYDELVDTYGEDNVWTSDEISQAFTIEGFMAPFVVGTRKSDNVRGSLTFTHLKPCLSAFFLCSLVYVHLNSLIPLFFSFFSSVFT